MGRLSDSLDEIEKLYFQDGETYQEIADRFGKSREAIRQLLNIHFPGRVSGWKFRRDRIAQKHTIVNNARLEKLKETAPPCVICGNLVLRPERKGPRRTCSPYHASLWYKAKFLLDDGLRIKQRESMARSILNNPDHYENRPASIDWAKKVLRGETISNRVIIIEDSEARLAYNEVMKIRESEGYHG